MTLHLVPTHEVRRMNSRLRSSLERGFAIFDKEARLLVCQPFVGFRRRAHDRAVTQTGVVRVRPHAAKAHTQRQPLLRAAYSITVTTPDNGEAACAVGAGPAPGRHLLKKSSQRFRGLPSGTGHPARAVA